MKFKSAPTDKDFEMDEYIYEKVMKAKEKYDKKHKPLKQLEDMRYRHNIIKANRKAERQNRKRGRK